MKKSLKIIVILVATIGGVLGFALLTESSILSSYKSDQSGKRPNNGEYKEYYDNGSLYSIEYYENGLKEGVWRYYYKNSKLKMRQSYSNNKLNGTVYHFSTAGDLIYNEIYRNDSLVEKLIVNDSLYNYEVVFETHGHEMFNKACISCHKFPTDKNLRLGLNNLESFVDTISITELSIDSIHSLYADSLEFQVHIDNVEIGPKQGLILDKYDLEAILQYIENEVSRGKTKKRHRKKNLRLRKKMVYLFNITLEPRIA